MREGFDRFKQRIYRNIIIKTLLCGVSAGFLTAAALLAFYKITANPILSGFVILVSVVAALLAATVCWLCLRPSDRRIAKQLDTALSLREKVQTMVAYEGEEGEMITLQRTDTNDTLKSIPAKTLKLKKTWRYILSAALTCALLVTALVVPGVTAETPHYELTQWQLTALRELIRDVQASDMQADAKTMVVSDLEGLITALPNATNEAAAKLLALGVIYKVDATVRVINTAPEIGVAMQDSTLATVNTMAPLVAGLDVVALQTTMAAIRTQLGGGNVGDNLRAFAGELSAALARSGILAGDPLYDEMTTWITELTRLAEQTADYSPAWVATQLESVLRAAEEGVSDTLLQQHTNETVGDMVITRLAEIFDIPETELPHDGGNSGGGQNPDDEDDKRPDDTETEPDDKDDFDDRPQEGGFGSGDILYGSDDIIYYPDENRYVSYGEVINGYHAIVIEQMNKGGITDEMRQFISDYFTSLFVGIEKETD